MTQPSTVPNKLLSFPNQAQALFDQAFTLLQQGSRKQVQQAITMLCEELFLLKQKLPAQQWANLPPVALQHPINTLLRQAPQIRYSQQWSRGYRGDAAMMDLIYSMGQSGQQLAQCTQLGQYIHEAQEDWATHRAALRRLRSIAKAIDLHTQQLNRPLAILSVACGHLREVSFCHTWHSQNFARWVAMDQDAASLEVIKSLPRSERMEYWQQSITALLRRPQAQQFDFIYAAGLYDYLSEKVAKLLTQRLFELLRPGGQLLVANFTPETQEMAFLEAFMDWPLIYRNTADLTKIAATLPGESAQFRIYQDLLNEQNRLVYLEVTRKNV